jgi:ABC-type spermidine/putrescine transport system permease subunit I
MSDWRTGAAIALVSMLIVLGVFALLLAHVDRASDREAGAALTSTR